MSPTDAHILVVDDEPNIRKLLAGVLEDEGYTVSTAADAEQAEAQIAASAPDLVLLDVQLPGKDGLAFLKELQRQGGDLPVMMMSGHGTIRTAVLATKLGAHDFIEKPIQAERLLVSLANCLRLRRLSAENRQLKEALEPLGKIIGSSEAMTRLREEIARVASTEARVLITGENGTGKELVAAALHAGSQRSARPFVKVNCAAIPSELLESELFGHEKGAFTGAIAARRGKFELAQRGTVLLDEVGDMNSTTQAKLLRVLEQEEMERVGGEKTISLDVRVFASTNQDLPALMKEGKFREDLYHRLQVVPIHVLPLREHAGDVVELAEYYLKYFCEVNGRRVKRLSEGAMEALRAYRWPGNVRELKNLMERVVIMREGKEVGAELVRAMLAGVPGHGGGSSGAAGEDETEGEGTPVTLAEKLLAYERQLLEQALAASGGNVAQAARDLGLDRANLHRRLQRRGLRNKEST